jgi:hypothetical protein
MGSTPVDPEEQRDEPRERELGPSQAESEERGREVLVVDMGRTCELIRADRSKPAER